MASLPLEVKMFWKFQDWLLNLLQWPIPSGAEIKSAKTKYERREPPYPNKNYPYRQK